MSGRLPSLRGDDVIRGLLHKIIADAGLTADEFEALV